MGFSIKTCRDLDNSMASRVLSLHTEAQRIFMKNDMHEIANTMLGLIRSKPTQEYNIRISSERPFAVCADPSNKTLLDFFAECRQEWRRVCDTDLDAYLLAQVEARFRHRMQPYL